MTTDGELWHIVEARRDDGTPTMFRIRELAPRTQLTKIFVVELPYPKTELSRLPNATDYRRLAEFDEQWLRPACSSLGWELVGSKTEDGSFFLYMYGATDPNAMIEKLAPFDAALGFYDDDDPEWQEYGTLRELLDQAKAIPVADEQAPAPEPAPRTNGAPRIRANGLKPPARKPVKKAAARTNRTTAKKAAPAKARAKSASKSSSSKAKGKKPARKRR
jgi:hypothetical protein